MCVDDLFPRDIAMMWPAPYCLGCDNLAGPPWFSRCQLIVRKVDHPVSIDEQGKWKVCTRVKVLGDLRG